MSLFGAIGKPDHFDHLHDGRIESCVAIVGVIKNLHAPTRADRRSVGVGCSRFCRSRRPGPRRREAIVSSSKPCFFARRQACHGAICPSASARGRRSTTGSRTGRKKGHWATIFKELQLEVDETGSIVDGSVVRAHQDASGGKGGSNAMLWAVLEEVFRPSSTPSSTRKAARSTSRSRRGSGTR